ncbi:DNA-cytosine methyltransferase [Desulfuromonas soudanensis]|uniref:Cytosine-specific methyltransferase n=1 Tax=Desulfuromonas soudanensis TaxID=1603606 RepID=A0A0M4CZA3_9BACT|nr:DNA (cytosine-5-)-methyltransferase [Desulfuromonas soudanensis]ALC15321.1 DNA-cytosine methyltransferase [Desulfuromonas soudanensis]
MEDEAVWIVKKVVGIHGYDKVAETLGVSTRSVRRWEAGETGVSRSEFLVLEQMALQFFGKHKQHSDFTFIDLFAGIGGLRMAFEGHGGECIFTSEWDEYCQKTYLANFCVDHELAGDINVIVDDVRKHIPVAPDLLVAGFPCQPFSIAGVSKKNALGRPHGFACKEQGNLFFHVASFLDELRPPAFLLENVKNLERHDKGNTFRVIMDTLTKDLGYKVDYKVIDAKGFVPQHRERIFIVGFDGDTGFNWDDFRHPGPKAKTLKDILEPESKVDMKYILSDKLWLYLQNYAAKHKAAGNGFGFGLVGRNDTARTLSARYYKDGSEILIDRGKGKNPRRLTPRECARLMGFPDSFVIPVSDTRAYKQFGNSVVSPVVNEVARIMAPHILALKRDRIDKYEVVLCSTGNPDYGQTTPQSPYSRRWVTSPEEAVDICRKYIEHWNLGSGNWCGESGKVMQYGALVAMISYNGRILPVETPTLGANG